jgi:hypothetical protein
MVVKRVQTFSALEKRSGNCKRLDCRPTCAMKFSMSVEFVGLLHTFVQNASSSLSQNCVSRRTFIEECVVHAILQIL